MKTTDITEKKELEEIIKESRVCFIGMVDREGKPYVLPFNFAYGDGILYFHSGNEGRKLSILKEKPDVCITFSKEGEMYIQSPSIGCSYSMQFESVLAYGKVEFIDDFERKIEMMHRIMHHYTPNREYTFSEPSIQNIACFTVKIERMTGRRRWNKAN